MLRTGMLSITFRQLQPEEIIGLTVQAGLEAIEWGGDIHVPHGDVSAAKRVKQLMDEAGLVVASYGSYYKAGVNDPDGPAFEEVLSSAVALGAPAIRIWAGDKGSMESSPEWRDQVTSDLIRVANQAEQHNIRIHLEFHGHTLTDTLDSTIELLEAASHANVRTNWQPLPHLSYEQQLESLDGVLPFLADVHVYYWQGVVRFPLSDGSVSWAAFLDRIRSSAVSDCFAMLEFVRDDDPGQFLEDARVLRRLLES